MWILIVVFQLQTFAVVVDSREDCQAVGRANIGHWATAGQQAKAICMRTVEI